MQLFLQTLRQFLSWGNFTGVSIEVPQQKRGFMLHKPLSLKNFLIISSSYYFSSFLNAFTQCFHQNIQNSIHLSVHYAEKLASSQFCIYKIHWPVTVKGRNVHSRYEHLSRTYRRFEILFLSLKNIIFILSLSSSASEGELIWIFFKEIQIAIRKQKQQRQLGLCVFF